VLDQVKNVIGNNSLDSIVVPEEICIEFDNK
jgi:hypothetical protein